MSDSLPLPNGIGWESHRDELEAFARHLDPDTRLKVKRSSLWNVGFLKRAATTLGRTVWIPKDWTPNSVKMVLPHEVLGHIRQFRIAGFGLPQLGVVLMAIGYGLIFFPIFLAWVRYRCELHAETKAWEYQLTNGMRTPQEVRDRAVRFANTVASWAYLKPWPKRWVCWGFNRRVEKVIQKVARGS